MAAIDRLFEAAAAARRNAYAPYSNFAVGAAILTASGAVFAGANVENAAYPVGLCAEASAIAAMITAGERRIAEVFLLAEGAEPIMPCGACPQRLFEFATAGHQGPQREFVGRLAERGARRSCFHSLSGRRASARHDRLLYSLLIVVISPAPFSRIRVRAVARGSLATSI